MDLNKFLAVLRHELGQPITNISSQTDLNEATEALCNALVLALGTSTPVRWPCSHSKKWWSVDLTVFLSNVHHAEHWFHRHRTPSTKRAWLDARKDFYRGISQAKEQAWWTFVQDLERTSVYEVLDRVRLRPRLVFLALVNLATGASAVDHLSRGRLLGKAWFGDSAAEVETGRTTGRVGAGRREEGEDENDNENNNNNKRKNKR
ncbi:hypothetical protein B0H13DRAFT_1902921 [Mycena leptocephala]|nr:hypothetical protein B0H13DRAFT_1902921 [Mycena leptocephala]